MPYRTCYYQRDFNGITLEKKHPCTGIGSRFSSCSALDNSTRFLMAIEVEKTRSFQQFRTLQGPLLAHQFGEVRMQRPNLVYPRHQAVQVLLAPRTPKRFGSAFAGPFFLGCDVAFGDRTFHSLGSELPKPLESAFGLRKAFVLVILSVLVHQLTSRYTKKRMTEKPSSSLLSYCILLAQDCLILVVTGLVLGVLLTETIVDILKVFSNAALDAFIL